jgi:hypothetical protein
LSTNETESTTVVTPTLSYAGEALALGRLQLTLVVEDEEHEFSEPVSVDISWGERSFLPMVID